MANQDPKALRSLKLADSKNNLLSPCIASFSVFMVCVRTFRLNHSFVSFRLRVPPSHMAIMPSTSTGATSAIISIGDFLVTAVVAVATCVRVQRWSPSLRKVAISGSAL